MYTVSNLNKSYLCCNLCIYRSVETVENGSVTTSVTVTRVIDTKQQQQQTKSNVGTVAASRRVASHSVALSNSNSISNIGRVTPRSHMEQEKRIRREIANSNERRRMQSINAGFQSLRTLLPHHEGEKLSKVSHTLLDYKASVLDQSDSCADFPIFIQRIK